MIAVAVPPAGSQEIRRPNIGGHTFLSTDIVPDAFVRTYVRNSLGYAAAANLEYPSVVIGGDTLLSLEGNLSYATLGFEYQQAVKDWIALRVALDGRTRLGTQVSSIVLDGVTVNAGYDLRWLVRVHESSRTMLSGSLGLSQQTFTRIDVKGFVEDVIAGTPNPRIIDDVPALRSYAGAHLSWAISRPFGFTGILKGSYGETPWRDEPSGWGYEYGGTVDFDAGPAWRVPVGLALGYLQQSSPSLTNNISGASRTGVLRIAYNAQPDFIVGIDVTRMWNREENRSNTLAANGGALTLRYYF
jgi:hypothetical protein